MSNETTITTSLKKPEMVKELFSYELNRAEKTIEEANARLTSVFGLSLWQEGNALVEKAVAIKTRNFLKNIEPLLEPGADLSSINEYCLQIFRYYVTAEVDRSTSFTRELEYDAKRTAYKKQLQILVSFFHLDCTSTIRAAMWL